MEFLIDNPLLTLCVTIALGAAFGLVRFGPVRLGAAGALFVGLFIGAFDTEEQIGSSLSLVKTLGLGPVRLHGRAGGRAWTRPVAADPAPGHGREPGHPDRRGGRGMGHGRRLGHGGHIPGRRVLRGGNQHGGTGRRAGGCRLCRRRGRTRQHVERRSCRGLLDRLPHRRDHRHPDGLRRQPSPGPIHPAGPRTARGRAGRPDDPGEAPRPAVGGSGCCRGHRPLLLPVPSH